MTTRFLPILIAIVIVVGMQGCKKDGPTGTSAGPAWVVFNKGNSPIFSNHVRAIYCDAENIVWFGTDSGASNYHNNSWGGLRDSLRYNTNPSNNPPIYSSTVNCISQSLDGSLWFGLQGGGLVRYNKNGSNFVFKRYVTPDVPFNTISSVAGELSQLGEVFVSCLVNGAGRYTPNPADPGNGGWHSLLSDHTVGVTYSQVPSVAINLYDKSIWFGTYKDGIVRYDGDITSQPYILPDQYNYATLSIAFDANGFAWFAKADSGVSVLKVATGEWVHHYTYFSSGGRIQPGRVNAVVTDYHKSRWFGTDQGGLVGLIDTTWVVFNTGNSSLPSNTITSLCYDQSGNLWIGTPAGVAVYKKDGTIL